MLRVHLMVYTSGYTPDIKEAHAYFIMCGSPPSEEGVNSCVHDYVHVALLNKNFNP